jgi:methionyl-tRNA formyltransferase
MPLVFFGTPAFALPSLNALLEAGEKIEAVVTQRDKRRGRRHSLAPPPVKEFALEKGLSVLQPSGMKDEEFLRTLEGIGPEFIVVVAFGRILPRRILDIPPGGAINVHASLLPKYRGASPVAWAIINGEAQTGVTTMLMSEGLDEGDVILQESMPIEEDDTTESLSAKLAARGGPLLLRSLKGLREGSIVPRPQAGQPSFAPPFKKEDGHVDWSKTARELYNLVRGMHPWPGAFCYINGERVRLLKVKPVEGSGRPGEIVSAGENLLAGTGGGLLSIEELQPEGKGPMTGGAFVRGRKTGKGALIT